jgi:hypothetical protein
MQRSTMAALGLGALAALAPASGRADSYWDLEHARANARAGGPVSEYDAELLERYGCLSGTRNEFCERLSGNRRYATKKARYRAEQRAPRDD